MVEGARLLRERQRVGATLMGDLEKAFLDVDVRRSVLTHGSELDEVNRRVGSGDRVQDIERSNHVVDLRVHGVVAIDHRVRG